MEHSKSVSIEQGNMANKKPTAAKVAKRITLGNETITAVIKLNGS